MQINGKEVEITPDFKELTEVQKEMKLDSYKCKTNHQKEVFNWINLNLDKWMFLIGSTGSGKTHLATGIYKYQKAKGKNCHYTSNLEMLRNCIGNFINEGIIRGYEDYDLLVIDEAEKFWRTQKENEINVFFEIINKRHANKKQTIIISNYNWDELIEVIGKQNKEPLERRFSERGKVINCDWGCYKEEEKK